MNKSTLKSGYIMLIRSELVLRLIKNRPSAYLLLTQIALRVKRSDGLTLDNLSVGEAYIGDFRTYGVTEQVYRSDKKFLEKYKLATFKPTPRGTIAKLVNTDIFDVNLVHPTNEQTSGQRNDNGVLTTNKNDRSDKNVKKYNFSINSAKNNPILEDPNFKRYESVFHGSDDASVRAKMRLLPLLESRYPAWKFQPEWNEVRKRLGKGDA